MHLRAFADASKSAQEGHAYRVSTISSPSHRHISGLPPAEAGKAFYIPSGNPHVSCQHSKRERYLWCLSRCRAWHLLRAMPLTTRLAILICDFRRTGWHCRVSTVIRRSTIVICSIHSLCLLDHSARRTHCESQGRPTHGRFSTKSILSSVTTPHVSLSSHFDQVQCHSCCASVAQVFPAF